MQRAALIGAVEFNAGHFESCDFDFVVAVDRGFATCQQHGIEPDVVVGDFDSLGYVPSGIDVQVHSPVKDESDMELALRLAHEHQATDVVLYGALGARLDHTLANLQLMAGQAKQGVRIAAVDCEACVIALAGNSSCNKVDFDAFDPAPLDAGTYGRFISAFALGGDAHGVAEQGFAYEVSEAVLPCTASLGLSNEFTGQDASIEVATGAVLATFGIGAWPFMRML